MKGSVEAGTGTAQFLNAGIDCVQTKIFNEHVGSGIVADNDHQGGGILYPEFHAGIHRMDQSASGNHVLDVYKRQVSEIRDGDCSESRPG